jgi:hypothetical protein
LRRLNRWQYALFSGLSVGVLGGLVFFIWELINNSFLVLPALYGSVRAFILFAILGFILGLLIGNLD